MTPLDIIQEFDPRKDFRRVDAALQDDERLTPKAIVALVLNTPKVAFRGSLMGLAGGMAIGGIVDFLNGTDTQAAFSGGNLGFQLGYAVDTSQYTARALYRIARSLYSYLKQL